MGLRFAASTVPDRLRGFPLRGSRFAAYAVHRAYADATVGVTTRMPAPVTGAPALAIAV